jgi:DNA-binding transcriptional ArsR family regulator
MKRNEEVSMATRKQGKQDLTSTTTKDAQIGAEDICQEHAIHPEDAQAVRRNLLNSDSARRIAALFSVLSDPTRLQVVYALLRAPSGELCVCDLAAGLRRDDTTISHQLRVLRQQQIVDMRKVGRVVYYRLVDDHVRHLLELGLTHATESSLPSYIKEVQVPA